MIMFKRLPYFVFLQGKKYRINVDFRTMISFENNLLDKTKSKAEKIEKAIRSFYPVFSELDNYKLLTYNAELYKEACDKLIWFYKCGREDYQKERGSKGTPINQVYSYEYDDEYIWSAFYQYYKIDLSKDRLHWWKYKSIFKSLPEECKFEKIKGYRAYKGDDKDIKELKQYYKLPLPKSEQDRLDALYEQFK